METHEAEQVLGISAVVLYIIIYRGAVLYSKRAPASGLYLGCKGVAYTRQTDLIKSPDPNSLTLLIIATLISILGS